MDAIFVKIPEIKSPKFFHIISAGRILIGNKKSEFVYEKIIKLEIREITERNVIYDYALISQSMNGSAIIHSWTAEIEMFQNRLILISDITGKLENIGNFSTIYERWEKEFVQKLKRKYINNIGIDDVISETSKTLKNKDRYIKNFIGYSSWRFLFQDWYRKHLPQEQEELLLKNYFGDIDLPLIIHTESIRDKVYDSKVLFRRTAELDNMKFKRKQFAEMLKNITNIYNIEASISLDMEESYTFQNNGWCEEAELFLQTSVNNWYLVGSAHQIKQITETEAYNLGNQFDLMNKPKDRKYHFLVE